MNLAMSGACAFAVVVLSYAGAERLAREDGPVVSGALAIDAATCARMLHAGAISHQGQRDACALTVQLLLGAAGYYHLIGGVSDE